jgi:hypothetical protein
VNLASSDQTLLRINRGPNLKQSPLSFTNKVIGCNILLLDILSLEFWIGSAKALGKKQYVTAHTEMLIRTSGSLLVQHDTIP